MNVSCILRTEFYYGTGESLSRCSLSSNLCHIFILVSAYVKCNICRAIAMFRKDCETTSYLRSILDHLSKKATS